MSGTANREELRRRAQSAFVQEECLRPGDPRIVREDMRQKASTAKTTGLRELRLARDAARHEATEAIPLPAEK
ncbi:MAG: hypothetical protein ACHQAY_10145 [Hyphomicrobiales bacterium]